MNMFRQTNHRNCGFTLVEIMIVVFILGIAMLAVGKFHKSGFQSTVAAKQRSEAVTLAEQQIEHLKKYASKEHFLAIVNSGAEQQIQGQNETYSRRYTVRDLANGDKEVTVTVSWPESSRANSEQNQVELVTILAAINTSSPNTSSIRPTLNTASTTAEQDIPVFAPTPAASPPKNPDNNICLTGTKTEREATACLSDEIACSCSGNSANMNGHNSMHGSYSNNAQLTSACDSCCGINSSSHVMGSQSGSGSFMPVSSKTTSMSCRVYRDGHMTGH